jgi:hypothetical protein
MRIEKDFKHAYNPTEFAKKRVNKNRKQNYKAILFALILISFGFFAVLLLSVVDKITIPFR